MKKSPISLRPLSLNRETLRSLDRVALREVDGAASLQNSCDPISVRRCPGSAQSLCEGCDG